MTQPRQFDPYYIWLGISPEEQPANHYRLLDIRPFESNYDIIDTGYNRRMAYLRSVKDGDYLELAEKLKDDLATARLCLTNPTKKSAYDAELRRGATKLNTRQPFAPQLPLPLPAAMPLPSMPPMPPISYGVAIPVGAEQTPPDAEAGAASTWAVSAWAALASGANGFWLRVAIGAAALLLLIGGTGFMLFNRGETYVTRIEILEDEDPPSVEATLPTPIPSPASLPLPQPKPPEPLPKSAPEPTSVKAAPLKPPVPMATVPTIIASLGSNLPGAMSGAANPLVTANPPAMSLPVAVPSGTPSGPATEEVASTMPAAPMQREFELEIDATRFPNISATAPTLTYDGTTPLTIEFWYQQSDRVTVRARLLDLRLRLRNESNR